MGDPSRTLARGRDRREVKQQQQRRDGADSLVSGVAPRARAHAGAGARTFDPDITRCCNRKNQEEQNEEEEVRGGGE